MSVYVTGISLNWHSHTAQCDCVKHINDILHFWKKINGGTRLPSEESGDACTPEFPIQYSPRYIRQLNEASVAVRGSTIGFSYFTAVLPVNQSLLLLVEFTVVCQVRRVKTFLPPSNLYWRSTCCFIRFLSNSFSTSANRIIRSVAFARIFVRMSAAQSKTCGGRISVNFSRWMALGQEICDWLLGPIRIVFRVQRPDEI